MQSTIYHSTHQQMSFEKTKREETGTTTAPKPLEDQLFTHLLHHHYIDESGLCLNTMPQIPEIGSEVEKKILQLFTCSLKKEFVITNGELISIEFSLKELFHYLISTQKNTKIEEIEIFGSTVPWLLQEGDFLDRTLQLLKAPINKQQIENFANNPSDLDLRVRIPSAQVNQIKAIKNNMVTFLCDKINFALQEKGRSLSDNDRNLVIQKGFSKYTSPKDQRISAVIGLEGIISEGFFKDFDILFEKDNPRKCMMSLDALRLPIMSLILGKPRAPIYPVADFSTGPWQPIIDRLHRISRAENLETLDPIAIKRAFSDSLLGYISVTKDLETKLLHKIVTAIQHKEEWHLLPQLSKEVQDAQLKDKIVFVISEWLINAADSHFRLHVHAKLLITLKNFAILTKNPLPETDFLIQEIWKRMNYIHPQEAPLLEAHSVAPIDARLHPLLLEIKGALNKDLSLLDPILALLEVKAFLLACNSLSQIDSRLSLFCLHGCLDLKIDNLHYFLPVDPSDALNRLSKGITPENGALFLRIDRAIPRRSSFDRQKASLIKGTLRESQLKAIGVSLTKYLNTSLQKENHFLCLRLYLEAFFAVNQLGMDGISFNRVESFIPKMTSELETMEEKQLFLEDIRTCKLQPHEMTALESMQDALKSHPTSTALIWAQSLLQTGDETRISSVVDLCKSEIKSESTWNELLSSILEKVSLYRLDLFAKLLLEWTKRNIQPDIILKSLVFVEKALDDNRNKKTEKAKSLLFLLQTLEHLATKLEADQEFIAAFNNIITMSLSHSVSTDEILKTCSRINSNWIEYGDQKVDWITKLLEKNQWTHAYKLWEMLFSSAEEPGALDSLERLLSTFTSQPAKFQSTELIKLPLTLCKHDSFYQLLQVKKAETLQLLDKGISLALGWKKDDLTPYLIQMIKNCSNKLISSYISFYLISKGHPLKPEIKQWILDNWKHIVTALMKESPSLCLAFLSNCATTHKLKWASLSTLPLLVDLLHSSLTPKEKIRAHTLFSEVRMQLKEMSSAHREVESIIQSLLKEKLYTEAKEWLSLYECSDAFVLTFQQIIKEAEENKMDQLFDFVKMLTLADEKISGIIAEAFSAKFTLSDDQTKQLSLSLQLSYPEKIVPVRIAWIKALAFSGIQEKCEYAYHLSCNLTQELNSKKTEESPFLKELLHDLLIAFKTTFPILAAKILIEAYPKYIDFETTSQTMVQLYPHLSIKPENEQLPLLKTLTIRFLELKGSQAPDGFVTLLHTLIMSEKSHQLLFKLQNLANPRFLSKKDWEICQSYYVSWIERFNLITELTDAGNLWSLWCREIPAQDKHASLANSLDYLLHGLSQQLEKHSSREILQQYLIIIQSDQGIQWLYSNHNKTQTLSLLIGGALQNKKPLMEEVCDLMTRLITTQELFSIGIKVLYQVTELTKPPHAYLKHWMEQNYTILTNATNIGQVNAHRLIGSLGAFQCAFPEDFEPDELLNVLYDEALKQAKEDLKTNHGRIEYIRKSIHKKEPSPDRENRLMAFFNLYLHYRYFKEAREWALLLRSFAQRSTIMTKIVENICLDENAEELLDPLMLDANEMQQVFANSYVELLLNPAQSTSARANLLNLLPKKPICDTCIQKQLLIDPENSITSLFALSDLDWDSRSKMSLFKLAFCLFPSVSSDQVYCWLDRIFSFLHSKEGRKFANDSFKIALNKAFGSMIRCMDNREPVQPLLFNLLQAQFELQVNCSLTSAEAELHCTTIIQHYAKDHLLLSSIYGLIKSPFFFRTIQTAPSTNKWALYFFATDTFLKTGDMDNPKEFLPFLFEIHRESVGKVWKDDETMIKTMQSWIALWKDDAEESGKKLMNMLDLPESSDAIHFKEVFYSKKDPFERLKTLSDSYAELNNYIPLFDIQNCIFEALKFIQQSNLEHYREGFELALYLMVKLKKPFISTWYLLIKCSDKAKPSQERLSVLWSQFWSLRTQYTESSEQRDLYLLCCTLQFETFAKQRCLINLTDECLNEMQEYFLEHLHLDKGLEALRTFLSWYSNHGKNSASEQVEELINKLISHSKKKGDFVTWIIINADGKGQKELEEAFLEYKKTLFKTFPKQTQKNHASYSNTDGFNLCNNISTILKGINNKKSLRYLSFQLIAFLKEFEFITRFKNGRELFLSLFISMFELKKISVNNCLEIILHLYKTSSDMQHTSLSFLTVVLNTVLQANRDVNIIESEDEAYFNQEVTKLFSLDLPICRFSRLNQIPHFESCMKVLAHIYALPQLENSVNFSLFPDNIMKFLDIGYKKFTEQSIEDNTHTYLFSFFLEASKRKMDAIPNHAEDDVIKREFLAIIDHFIRLLNTWFTFLKTQPDYYIPNDPMMELMDKIVYFPFVDKKLCDYISMYRNIDFSSKWLDDKRRYQYSIFLQLPNIYYQNVKNPEQRIEFVRELITKLMKDERKIYTLKCALMIIEDLDPLSHLEKRYWSRPFLTAELSDLTLSVWADFLVILRDQFHKFPPNMTSKGYTSFEILLKSLSEERNRALLITCSVEARDQLTIVIKDCLKVFENAELGPEIKNSLANFKMKNPDIFAY